MPVPILQGLLTPAEAAEYLGVTPKTLHRWVRADRLDRIKLGHHTTRFRLEDLEQLIAEASE